MEDTSAVVYGRRGPGEPSNSEMSGQSSEEEDSELFRAVQTLSQQVDAAIGAGSPNRPFRTSFRKSKQKSRAAMTAASLPVWTGSESSRWAPEPPQPAARSSPPPPRRDPEQGGVKPVTLRNRLIKTMDAALAEKISKYGPSRHSTPLIFASALTHKLRRVSLFLPL